MNYKQLCEKGMQMEEMMLSPTPSGGWVVSTVRAREYGRSLPIAAYTTTADMLAGLRDITAEGGAV